MGDPFGCGNFDARRVIGQPRRPETVEFIRALRTSVKQQLHKLVQIPDRRRKSRYLISLPTRSIIGLGVA